MPDPYESKSVTIAIVDKGFVEALQDWGKYLDNPRNEELKGKMGILYFLQHCRMPKPPSRPPTRAELSSLEEVVAKVLHYRELAQSDQHWDRYWANMGESHRKELLKLGQSSDTTCVKYLKEAFLLRSVDTALPKDFTSEGIKELYNLQGNLNGISIAANVYESAIHIYESVDDVLDFEPRSDITYQAFKAEQELRVNKTPPEIPPDPGDPHVFMEPPEVPEPPPEHAAER